ncbi:MAG: hypothetical protein KGJ90_06475 [Patescibacteria group bacterium]|nr:hypothetical protein [Patescibacteria group bacterium]
MEQEKARVQNSKSEPDRVISSHELREELNNLPVQQRFNSGFKTLDGMTVGFREGDMIILSGITGHGKTQFAVSLVNKFLENNINSLFFSFELTSQELMERFGIDVPVFYLPRLMTSKAIPWIKKKIEEGVKNFGTKVVFIDHLHYLVDETVIRNRNESEIIAGMCRELKLYARQKRIILFLLAHVRKLNERERPTMDDLKSSAGIPQEADMVMFIHRQGQKRSRKKSEPEDEMINISNDAWLYLDKVRHHGGHLGRIKYEFTEDGFYKELED